MPKRPISGYRGFFLTAQNVMCEVKGVPIFYVNWMQRVVESYESNVTRHSKDVF